MVFITGKHIETINAFSSSFLAILKLIVDGYEWLKWAIDDPSLSMYHAKSEQDLLSKIQTGLHDTPLIRSEVYMMHIDKAISMDEADLPILSEIFEGPTNQPAITETLKSRYELVSNEELQANTNFLEDHKLTNAPQFQGLGFKEQLALAKFKNTMVNTSNIEKAVSFALNKSADSLEFIHYFNFYQNCNTYQLPKDTDDNLRSQLIEEMYEQLSELSFSLIYVPNIGHIESTNKLAGFLKDFVVTSEFIGFRVKAAALDNLSKNITIQNVSTNDLKTSIEKYLTIIRKKVSQGSFTASTFPQDGWLRTFTCIQADFQTVVQVSPAGEVFLSTDTQNIESKSSNQ